MLCADVTYVKCKSEKGNIDHYYHFLYACVLPLTLLRDDLANQGKDIRLSICESSFGKMRAKFVATFPDVAILPKCPTNPTILAAFDHSYGGGILDLKGERRNAVIRQFYESMPPGLMPPAPVEILLIGRAYSPLKASNHQGDTSTTQYTGALRRHILNMDELIQGLKSVGSVSFVYLEGFSIHEQFLLFRSAKVVVAQHGAALANIVFMRQGSQGVVEITPYNTSHWRGARTHAFPNCFRFAAFSSRIPYASLPQMTEFSAVNVTAIQEVVRGLLT